MTLQNIHGGLVQKPVFDSIPRKSEMSNVIPRFYTLQVPTDQTDGETGLRTFRNVDYVELLIPGDKGNAPVKRVNDAIKAQYPDAWRAFKERGEAMDMAGGGLPLKAWPGIRPEIAVALEQVHIFSVQQLAGMADQKLSQPGFMGLRDLREKARTFLEEAGKTAPLANLQAQIDDMQKKLAMRDDQLQQMIDKNTELQAQVSGGMPTERMPELSTPRGRRKQGEES